MATVSHSIMRVHRIAAATLVILVTAALLRMQAEPPRRPLWLAVLENDLLVPIGALTDGVWRLEPADDVELRRAVYAPVGKRPVEWPAAGSVLPTVWRAHLREARKKRARVIGPLQEDESSGQFGVRTDLGLPRDPEHGSVTHGVAVVGDATVRLFTPLEEASRRQDVLRFLDAPAVAAARAAVLKAAASEELGSRWKEASAEAMAAGSFYVEEMSASALDDGSTLFYVEQNKVPMSDCEVHVRATIVASKAGSLRLTAIEARPRCDYYINLSPVAIVERGGVACWIAKEIYEDGFTFLLQAPDIAPTSTSTCAIR